MAERAPWDERDGVSPVEEPTLFDAFDVLTERWGHLQPPFGGVGRGGGPVLAMTPQVAVLSALLTLGFTALMGPREVQRPICPRGAKLKPRHESAGILAGATWSEPSLTVVQRFSAVVLLALRSINTAVEPGKPPSIARRSTGVSQRRRGETQTHASIRACRPRPSSVARVIAVRVSDEPVRAARGPRRSRRRTRRQAREQRARARGSVRDAVRAHHRAASPVEGEPRKGNAACVASASRHLAVGLAVIGLLTSAVFWLVAVWSFFSDVPRAHGP